MFQNPQDMNLMFHEINHYLHVAVGFNNLLLNELGNSSGIDIESMVKSSMYVSQYLNKLSQYLSLVRNNAMQPSLVLKDVQNVSVRGMLEQIVDTNYNNNVSLVANDNDFIISVNKLMLENIFLNLIHNANKSNSDEFNIVLSIDKTNSGFAVSVTDDGQGIVDADLENIFAKGFSKNNSSGLGLYFSREVLSYIGASIRAESVPNCKTSFTVSFPLKNCLHS